MGGEGARTVAQQQRGPVVEATASRPAAAGRGTVAPNAAPALAELSKDDWRLFHDVCWPGRKYANLHHVVVGPTGVFVIHTQTWQGRIEVRAGIVRHDGDRRDKVVVAVADAAAAVGQVVPGLDPAVVKPVLAFVRDHPLFGWSREVMVCSTENLVTFLTSRPRVLSQAEVHETAGLLARSLVAAPPRGEGTPYARRLDLGPTGPTGPTGAARASRRHVGRSRRPVASWSEPTRSVLVLLTLVVAALLLFRLDVPAHLGDLSARTVQRVVEPVAVIGTTVSVPGTSSHPTLDVRAERAVLATSADPGIQPQADHQLLAVPLSVHNAGEEPWRPETGLTAVLYDNDGQPFSSDPAYTHVSAGRTLPAGLTLPPGRTVRRVLVFEVPRGTRVGKVHLTVGRGLATTVRWVTG